MIVSFYMYISKFFNPIQNLAEQFNWLQSAFASAEKVFSILDLEPKMQDAPDAIELTDIRGEIEFRDVWFSYIPGEWVLKAFRSTSTRKRQSHLWVPPVPENRRFFPDLPELRVPEG